MIKNITNTEAQLEKKRSLKKNVYENFVRRLDENGKLCF